MVATIFSQGRYNMRKVLLATTALVALGSVSAAHADISISGTAEFAYDRPNGEDGSMSSDGSLVIKSTNTTDSGLTIGAVVDQKWEAGTPQDAYIELKGDFGTFMFGTTDTALDRQDAALTGRSLAVQEAGDLTTSRDNAQVYIGGDSTAVNFISPSISGLTVYLSADQTNTDYGATYAMGPITVGMQKRNGATDDTLVGMGLSAAGFTIQAATLEKETDTGTKTKATDFGVAYTLGEVGLAAFTSNGQSDSITGIGATYDIAPGLSARLESYSNETSSVKTEGVYTELRVKF
jgi:predicted porin